MLAHLLPLTRTLRHRATAPPPCDFTARTAPPPPPLTALLHVRSRTHLMAQPHHTLQPTAQESSFKYERRANQLRRQALRTPRTYRSLNAAAAPVLASGARPGRASHRNSPAADDCRHELCAANNYLRCPAPRPGLASPRTSLASPSPLLTHASPSPSPSLTGGEDPQPCESCEDVECMFEHLVEDYMEDPNDTYDREYGVCTTVAGSGQTKTLYLTEPGMTHRDRTTPD